MGSRIPLFISQKLRYKRKEERCSPSAEAALTGQRDFSGEGRSQQKGHSRRKAPPVRGEGRVQQRGRGTALSRSGERQQGRLRVVTDSGGRERRLCLWREQRPTAKRDF